MATQIAAADGNLTSAATWGVVDATSLLDSEAANTALTTGYVSSSTFAPGAITIDGVAVKIATRAASPTGTMSVQIFNSTGAAAVAGTEVTVNVSDITATAAGQNGWLFLKFAAPVSLLAATNYTVQAKTSSATQVNLYRDGTANNWSRMLRTTTTGAPAAGDNFFILGEWTAAATKTNRSVTMNETASTDYGGTSTTLASVGISNGGTLTWGTTAATNYVLRISGLLVVWAGGVHSMGTTGTQIPRDSSAQLEFDCAVDGDFGMVVYGTYNGQGLSRSSGKDVYFCLLNTDEAAGQTVLGVDRDTGWLNADDVAIASTSTTASQAEERILNGAAGASSITVTVALTNAHSGTSPTQAEVILLTRNVRVRSVSTTAMAYVLFKTIATVDCDWVEFRYIGANTVGKRGVEVETTTGSLSLKYCSIRNSEHTGIYITGSAVNNITIDSCVTWAIAATFTAITCESATTGTSLTITACVILNSAQLGHGVHLLDAGWTFTNNRVQVATNGKGVTINESAILTGTVSGNIIHSCTGGGMQLITSKGGTISTLTVWRNTTEGLVMATAQDVVINGITAFGNTSRGLTLGAAATRITVRNGAFNGDSTAPSTHGVQVATSAGTVRFENCAFGVASGILVTHTTADIEIAGGAAMELFLINCSLASATEFTGKSNMLGRSFIAYQRVDQATNTHKKEYPALGIVHYDASTFRSAAPSERIDSTAATATFPLHSTAFYYPVASGRAITFAIYVRKSAAYNGTAPRLIMLANPAIGIDVDVTLDTMTAAADTWEQLTGTQTPVAEEDGVVGFRVEADGTAGSVYVDDASASSS